MSTRVITSGMSRSPTTLPLLLVLAVAVVLTTAFPGTMDSIAIGFVIIICQSIAAYMFSRRRRNQVILLTLGVSALTVQLLHVVTGGGEALLLLGNLIWMGFNGFLTALVVRYLFRAREVTRQELYGAVSVYLLIGILFADVYQLILEADPQAIHFDVARFQPGSITWAETLYYSFVTLATVGYGDVTPAAPLARGVSVIESIIGVMYLAILIARFVSLHSSRGRNLHLS